MSLFTITLITLLIHIIQLQYNQRKPKQQLIGFYEKKKQDDNHNNNNKNKDQDENKDNNNKDKDNNPTIPGKIIRESDCLNTLTHLYLG